MKRLDEWQKGGVEKNHLILRVIDDVTQLLREQPRVDGVADTCTARGAIINFKMPVTVPGKCADALAGLNLQALKHLCHLLGSSVTLGIGVTMDITLGASRDDLGVGVVARSVRQ